jgi:FixJ family two-component response regulator
MSATPKSQQQPIVFVVDDDISVRESLESLIQFAGWQPETFASAGEFLARPRVGVPSCLVLDVFLLSELRSDYESLTPRERDVMKLVVAGMLNKQIGLKLNISEI